MPGGAARDGHPPVAIRWAGLHASDEIEVMPAANRVSDFGSFRAPFRTFAVPGRNLQ